MKTTIQKNSKPISYDASQVKNYKIVCECNNIIIPTRICTIDIRYLDPHIDDNKTHSSLDNEPPLDIMNSCCKILESYGYSEEESKNMISKSFQKTNIKTIKNIIEYALKNFGVSYNE